VSHVRLSPRWYAADLGLSWAARNLAPWLLCAAAESPDERWLLTKSGCPVDLTVGPPGARAAVEELLLAGQLERREDGALGWTWDAWGLLLGLTAGALRQRRWRAKKKPSQPASPAPASPRIEPPPPRVVPGFAPKAPPVRVAPPPEVGVPAGIGVETERIKEALIYGRLQPDGTTQKPPEPRGMPRLRPPTASKLHELLSRGYTADEVLDAVWGLAEMIERRDADPVEWWRASRIFSGYFDTLVVMVTKWRADRQAKAAARLESSGAPAANEGPAHMGDLDIARMLQGTAYGGPTSERAASD